MAYLPQLRRVKPVIEPMLNVIAVISNPCNYRRRYELARAFFARMSQNPQVRLFVVELAYGDQPFAVTDARNPQHLQLRTDVPLWHKENLINLGVRKLLPPDWRAFAWIDADIEFKNPYWAEDTLRELSDADVIQPFSEAIMLDAQNVPTPHVTLSMCYVVVKNQPLVRANCGYAWAMTRAAYNRVGGLFPYAILGGGDAYMSKAFTKAGEVTLFEKLSAGFQRMVNTLETRTQGLRVGYVRGSIRHYYHGSLENRKYTSRWDTIIKYSYDPRIHVKYDAQGILVPTPECPPGLLADIMTYFRERNEDESIG